MRYHFPALLCWIVLILAADVLPAQQQVDPAVRARLDREFAEAYPQPGDYLPFCYLPELHTQRHNQTLPLNHGASGKARLLVTASLTCPKTRQHFPAIQAWQKKYKQDLGISVVYVLEAHPEIDICPYLGVVDITEANLRDKILYRQPIDMNQRMAMATLFLKRYPIQGSVFVDSMDNVAWRTLGQAPNLALLYDQNGQVIVRQGWFNPETLEPEIEKLIQAGTDQHADLRREGMGASMPGGMGNMIERELSPELEVVLKRLNADNPNTVDFVRWLETVDAPHFKRCSSSIPRSLTKYLPTACTISITIVFCS